MLLHSVTPIFRGLVPQTAAVFLVIFGTASTASASIVIDNFNDLVLDSEWVQSNAFEPASPATIQYDTSMNAGKLTWSYSSQNTTSATQSVLLRDDHKLLNDGDWVQVTTTINVEAGAGNAHRLHGGIAVGLEGATDRFDLFAAYVRSDGSVSVVYNNNGTVVAADIGSGLFPTVTAPGSSPAVWLRITRDSATSVTPSYSTDGSSFTSGTSFPISNLSAIGMGVGVFNGNAVTSRTGTVVFDDLTMSIVPEPNASLIMVLSSIGIGYVNWFRRR